MYVGSQALLACLNSSQIGHILSIGVQVFFVSVAASISSLFAFPFKGKLLLLFFCRSALSELEWHSTRFDCQLAEEEEKEEESRGPGRPDSRVGRTQLGRQVD